MFELGTVKSKRVNEALIKLYVQNTIRSVSSLPTAKQQRQMVIVFKFQGERELTTVNSVTNASELHISSEQCYK